MNSILLVVMGMLLLTAELISGAPAQFFEDDGQADLGLGELQDLGLVKRSQMQRYQCVYKCLACSDNTDIPMSPCYNACENPRSNPAQSRAYNACNKYLHSRKK